MLVEPYDDPDEPELELELDERDPCEPPDDDDDPRTAPRADESLPARATCGSHARTAKRIHAAALRHEAPLPIVKLSLTGKRASR